MGLCCINEKSYGNGMCLATYGFCITEKCDVFLYHPNQLSTKYLMMCKVYTDVGGIKYLYHVCPPVRKIIHSLKLVDYLHVQADNPWYNC